MKRNRRVAERYAPAVVDQPGRILVDFDEAWGPVGPHDWLRLEYQGPDLTNGTILVELTGKSGRTRRNVHFVEQWPAQTPLYARYEPGFRLDGEHVLALTVRPVQAAAVTVWSPETAFRCGYSYLGKEKDKDIARYCETLWPRGSYRPFEEGMLWDTQRSRKRGKTGQGPCCRTTPDSPALVAVTFSMAFRWSP